MTGTLLRPAVTGDYHELSRLLVQNRHHRHLDWRDPLTLLGAQPFLILERSGHITAALACPPDPPGIAWLRLFAAASGESRLHAWNNLWNAARDFLSQEKVMVAAIGLHDWLNDLLVSTGFQWKQELVLLEKETASSVDGAMAPTEGIRPMLVADLAGVKEVDAAAFPDLWQISIGDLHRAHEQSFFAFVYEEQGRLLGYQVTTRTSIGLHLARLAVYPAAQGKGIGQLLVRDLFWRAAREGIHRLTVNTQGDNMMSLSLYRKLGFQLTGEKYPVFTWSSLR